MSWIKLETHTFDKMEIYSIAQELDIDPDAALGKCCRVWSWFDANTTDGVTKSVTKALLDRYCGVTGFSKAMINAGWMHDDGDHLHLPYYERHNSATAKSRALGSKRQAKFKNNDKVTQQVTQQVTASEEKSLPESSHREEKIREDIKPIVASEAVDGMHIIERPAKPDCPHQEIISLYHEILPQCPQIRDWTPARKTQLRARWNEDEKRQDMGYWRQFFDYVAGCDFLVGRAGKSPFFADLEWLTKSANFTKIREGKYENRSNA